MAYHFVAENPLPQDLQALRGRLSEFELIEFFPIEVGEESFTLGISIPVKAMDDQRFRTELEGAMGVLITEFGFLVTDLYTGNAIDASEISRLAERISE